MQQTDRTEHFLLLLTVVPALDDIGTGKLSDRLNNQLECLPPSDRKRASDALSQALWNKYFEPD